MSRAAIQQTQDFDGSAAAARHRLIAGLPVTEHRLDLAGISTSLLEGGDGPPVVLLHDPGGHAAKWRYVIPDLVTTHRVIAPDLPGHGESAFPSVLDESRTLDWLAALIDRTCASPPVLIGLVLGGAIATRFALAHPDRVRQLVLVDSLGLQPFDPAPEFGGALGRFLAEPGEATHDALWRYCAHDLEAVQARMSDVWEPFAAYNIDRARSPQVQSALRSLMEDFGFPQISQQALARLRVPAALIWGRHDLATRLDAAERASARFGWPLYVIEHCADDPPIEQPRAFLDALRAILAAAPEARS